MERDAL